MKRKILIILWCTLLTVQSMAQSENKKEILTKDREQTAINQELINYPTQPIGVDAKIMLPDYNEPKTSFDTITNSLKFKLPPQYYGNSAIFPYSKKMFFYLESQQRQFLNLASYNLAYMALGWRFNDRLNINSGLLAIKQFSNYLPYGTDRSGVRFNLNYTITKQLNLNMWGQYITGSSINSPVDNHLPQTGTGASMVLTLGGDSQFGVGAEYQRDDKKEKWNYNAGGKIKLTF